MTESSYLPETELSRRVLKILCHLYEKIEILETFAKVVISSQSSTDTVIQSGDNASYVSLLKSTIVCTPFNARSMPQSWLLQQHSRQDEVVLRVIERIRQREGRSSTNLLVVGYRLMSDDPNAQISSSRSIEYRIPNSNTSRLQYSPWKVLLSRIGDDAMEFLLETRAVFVPAVSTVYVQLTGTPMYELWPFHRYYTQSQRNPATQKLCTSLLNDSRCKSRKRQRQHKSKMEPSPSSKEMSTGFMQPYISHEILSNTCTAVVQQENRARFRDNEHVETEVEDSRDTGNPKKKYFETKSKSFLVKKHKMEMSLDNEPDKKRRIVTTASVSMTGSECVVGHVTNSGLSVDCPHPERHRSSQVADSSQQSSTAYFRRQKHRRKRKGKLHDGNKKEHKQKTVAYDHRLVIERTPMLFSRDLTEKYPPKYVLFDSKINSSLKLVADILSVRILYNGKSSSVSCCSDAEVSECCSEVKQRLVNIIQLIIRNHQLSRYRYLLQHHCSFTNYSDETTASSEKQTCQKNSGSLITTPAPKLEVPVYYRGQKTSSVSLPTTPVCAPQEFVQRSKKESVQLSVRHLLEQHCSHRAVFLFVRACCLRVIPTELFGSAKNRNQFFQNVGKIIRNSRYEQLSIGCLMKSMRVTHCNWMKEIRSNTERMQLLAKVLCWIINAFVLPLIKSYFYVTDSATYRNKIFYYRKLLWKKTHQKGLAIYMQQGTLLKISSQEANEKVSSGVALGMAFLRFMPKSSSLRPIINLSKRTKVAGPGSRESTVNWQLLDVQNVLMYERQRCPSIVGASVFSLDDIYTAWKKFIDGRRARGDDRPLYFVKVDIENCYDSIDQQKLYDVLTTVLRGDYVIRRFVSVVEAGGRLRRTYHRDACSLADFQPSFVRFIKDRAEERGAHDAFFVDQVLHAHENAASLLHKLRSHLFHNVVKVGRRYFVQSQGIAQGSAVSTLLCNIYYGKMEASYITVSRDSELLMRQVDDFLYVTPSYENAVAFLTLMLRGVPEYNCYVNQRKTLVNFAVDSSLAGDAVPRLAAGPLFPWCGLLIDTSTLAVVADYTRYAGVSMSDTLTVDLTRNAGRAMRNKLMFALRARCHRIFFDTGVNCAAVENVYRVFVLAAFKLHAYAARLPTGPQRNPPFFVDLIFEVAGFVSSYTSGLAVADGLLEVPALQWLCLEAFGRKLGRHGGVYGAVLRALAHRQTALRRRLDQRHLAELRRIVGDDLPCDFQYILP